MYSYAFSLVVLIGTTIENAGLRQEKNEIIYSNGPKGFVFVFVVGKTGFL